MFIVLTFPRTGSELLITSLATHPQLKVKSELLNPHRNNEWNLPYFSEIDVNKPVSVIRYEQTEELATKVRDALQSIDGFKATYDQITRDSPVVEALCKLRELKIVFMERNPVESAISFWYAIKSQKWQRHKGEPPLNDVPEEVDEKFVLDFCNRFQSDHVFYKKKFAEHQHFHVHYNQLVSQWDKTTGELQHFLGVPVVSLPTLLEKRLTTPIDQLVKNYSEKWANYGQGRVWL